MRSATGKLLNHLLDCDGVQECPTRVFGVGPLHEIESGDGSFAATPDVLRDGVTRADVPTEKRGVDACVQAGGVPLE